MLDGDLDPIGIEVAEIEEAGCGSVRDDSLGVGVKSLGSGALRTDRKPGCTKVSPLIDRSSGLDAIVINTGPNA